MHIDTATPFGQRVAQRLDDDRLIWLTTVAPDGMPQPSPIWFLWDGSSVLMYSKPGTPKLRNIERNPRVSLHFDGNGTGGDIVVLNGEAHIADHERTAENLARYSAKYGAMMQRLGMNPATYSEAYSVAVRITPTRLRGHP